MPAIGHVTKSKDGNFKVNDQDVVRYVEADGKHRVMTDNYIGQLSEARSGIVAANLFLNVLHLIAWFLCLWLLLRFQWGHALGLAFVAWLVLTFFLPPLFKKTEDLAKQRATQATSSIQWFIPANRALAGRPFAARSTGGIARAYPDKGTGLLKSHKDKSPVPLSG